MRSLTAKSKLHHHDLLERLSYTHFEQLLSIDDELKRKFYEIECIRGNWSVRELRRQISTLYFERSSLSENQKKLSELTQIKVEHNHHKLNIQDPYIFEFLGIKTKDVITESHLESSLLQKLQDFLLELGHGFCLESVQKRILIGGKHYFIDLVFYHRILKCHILIELKMDEFKHEHLGQLNTYVNWYQKNMKIRNDNPPIGILLCTQKSTPLVEYALAGMNNKLFVSKYQIQLPEKEKIEKFLEDSLQEINLSATSSPE